VTKKLLLLILCGFVLFALFAVSCSKDRTSTGYETHPSDWMNPASEEFHGQAAILTGGESCGGCHIIAPNPGEYTLASENSTPQGTCRECHNGYPHQWLIDPTIEHALGISSNNWDFAACTACHGTDFAGGRSGSSCLQCHGVGSTPALTDCNLCHAQPPVDGAGMPAGFARDGFGAHAKHVIEKGYACTECHATVNGLEHVDAPPAEVSFTEALIATAKNSAPNYIHSGDVGSGSGDCSSVYCHGNGLGGPPNQPMIEPLNWLSDIQFTCQSCHATPPTDPNHPANGDCHACHPTMDPASEDYAILPELDSLHVNGIINVSFE
jgi:predicted CxxxxCH...CXXCH cytochrome family protein